MVFLKMARFLVFLLVFAFVCGCSTIQLQPTGRIASDQLLNARAIEDAVYSMSFSDRLRDRPVRLEVITQGIDNDYLISVIRAWVIHHGGCLAPKDTTAEIQLTVLVQVAGTDKEVSKWSIPIVLPSLQTGLSVTSIDLYESLTQVARCRLWAYGTDGNQHRVFTQPPVYASHFLSNREVFGISLGRNSDIYEFGRSHGLPPLADRIVPSN